MLKYEGKVVPFFERAEGLAKHLTEKQWGKNTAEEQNKTILEEGEVINTDIQLPDEEFTQDEFDDAVETLKKKKAHGTDHLDNEMIMMLDDHNRNTLRTYINSVWNSKKYRGNGKKHM